MGSVPSHSRRKTVISLLSLVNVNCELQCTPLSPTGSPRDLLLRLMTQRSVAVQSEWTEDSVETATAKLEYMYRVVCEPDYFGHGCSEMCRARDDKFGHYTCSANGTRVCLDGWTGSYCDKGESRCFSLILAISRCFSLFLVVWEGCQTF